MRGVRLVLDLNRVLPHPPLPPLATSSVSTLDHQVAQLLAGGKIRHHRAHRNGDVDVIAAVTRAIVAAAALAVLTPVGSGDAKVRERVHPLDRLQVDAAAESAVAAVGSSEGHELLAPETHAAAAAVAGLNLELGFVDELHGMGAAKTKKGSRFALPPSRCLAAASAIARPGAIW